MNASWFDGFRQDIAYAFRSLKRSPGMTAGILVTLALGLGVNAAMFSFLDVVFLRHPSGVRAPDEVRRVWNEIQFRSGAQFWSGYSYPEYAAIRDALGDRATLTMYRPPSDLRFGRAGQESQARASHVQASYFEFLGVQSAAGRFFTADEDRLGAGAPVAVSSYAFWRTTLGADPSAIGREIQLAGRSYTLIGVAAEGFSGTELDATDIWLPASSVASGRMPWWQNHNVNGFQVLLRPRDATISNGVLAERIAMGLSAPEARAGAWDTARVVVGLGSIIRARGPGLQKQEVTIATRLAGVTAVVLLIACANVVNLLLARAIRRRREIAVRLAVGISRGRLTRLLLTESTILALMAAVAASLAAYWGGALLRSLFLPDVKWATGASPLHWRVVTMSLAAGIGAGVVAGLLPALQSLRTELVGALKAGSSDDTHARRSGVRSALVIAQAALSVVLLVGAGLFVSSLGNVREIRTGFDARQIIFGGVAHDAPDSLRSARMSQVFRDLADRLRGATGVEAVALTRISPTRGFSTMTFHPDVDTTQLKKPEAFYNLVSREYFAATGMRIVRGEGFPPGVPRVVVVNEQFARAQWPNMDPIGRCLRFETNPECHRVVGVVETVLFDKLIENPEPQYYLPAEHPPAGYSATVLVVRADARARDAVAAEMRRMIREAYPAGYPSINTMETYLEPQYRPWRMGATLFTAFGVLALIVAAIGIYSTVAYSVAQRTREFGVRTALGARTEDIVRHVLGGSLRMVAIGVFVGIALAIAAGRFVASLLYGIQPGDPGVMIGVAVVLLVIAAIAAFGPAWRAARVNPVTALRAD